MPVLRITLLGGFQAELDGAALTNLYSDRVRALLAYLAVEAGRPHPRASLVELLWGEAASPGGLRVALFHLRQSLLPFTAGDDPLLVIGRRDVALRADRPELWVDVRVFDELLFAVRDHPHSDPRACADCARRLARAVELYRGDLLAGLSLADAPVFEAWRLHEQEVRHLKALSALTALADYQLAAGEPATAANYARRALALEPWHEPAHRWLARALAATGDRAAALAQLDGCRQLLAEHLRIAPDDETEALVAEIRSAASRPDAHAAIRPAGRPLRAPLTTLVGRERELRRIGALLRDEVTRLVTLVGPGGAGKSRLAAAAAERLADAFPDGVWLIPLDDIQVLPGTAADEVAATIAQVLGLALYGSQPPTVQLAARLRVRRTLLILDGMEHLFEATDLLIELLRAAPALRLLVTSRVPLELQAAELVAVDGLPTPPVDAVDPLGYDAVELFVDRARRASERPLFGPKELELAAQICRQLAGLPLAMELAAAQLRQRGLDEIAAAVGADLDALAVSLRDLPERHRSLRAVFEGSWRLLGAELQAALVSCAVFRGGFTTVSAREVAGLGPEALAALAERSLLRASPVVAESGRLLVLRYQMHELLRRFAAERANGLWASLADRHAAHYLGLAGAQGPMLLREPTAAAVLAAEIENLQAAWSWAYASSNWDALGAGLEGLVRYLDQSGRAGWGEEAFAEAVGRARAGGAPAPLLTRLLTGQAAMQIRRGRLGPATALADEAAQLAASIGEAGTLAWASLEGGRALTHLGKGDEARARLDRALALAEGAGDSAMAAEALSSLAGLAGMEGDNQGVAAALERALPQHRAAGDRRGEARSLLRRGVLMVIRANLAEAKVDLVAGTRIADELGDLPSAAMGRVNLGIVGAVEGDLPAAQGQLQAALALYREAGEQRGEGAALVNLSKVALESGDDEAALEHGQVALVLARAIGSPFIRDFALARVGQALLSLGRHAEAAEALGELADHRVGQYDLLAGVAAAGLAEVAALGGDRDEALLRVRDARVHLAVEPTDPSTHYEYRAALNRCIRAEALVKALTD